MVPVLYNDLRPLMVAMNEEKRNVISLKKWFGKEKERKLQTFGVAKASGIYGDYIALGPVDGQIVIVNGGDNARGTSPTKAYTLLNQYLQTDPHLSEDVINITFSDYKTKAGLHSIIVTAVEVIRKLTEQDTPVKQLGGNTAPTIKYPPGFKN